ncbi:MAG: 50S ribosomal protein L15 [Synergistota bacterium]|nr:50S ribosomal protein L15 [Synergistota bacterium]
MELHDLRPAKGAVRKTKRLGQGPASGKGKTSGKGHKGQKSRSGGGVRPGFEGGQMPLTRRIPKRGFSNARFTKTYQLINIGRLEEVFKTGTEVGLPEMMQAGLVSDHRKPVKILASGELTVALTVRANAFSSEAMKKIQAAGGKAEVV